MRSPNKITFSECTKRDNSFLNLSLAEEASMVNPLSESQTKGSALQVELQERSVTFALE